MYFSTLRTFSDIGPLEIWINSRTGGGMKITRTGGGLGSPPPTILLDDLDLGLSANIT